MSLYICTDCGTTFDEPKEITEKHGLETPPYEKLLVCPECLGSDYDTAVVCAGCNKEMSSVGCYYLNNKHYCNKCFLTLEIPTHLQPGDYGLSNI